MRGHRDSQRTGIGIGMHKRRNHVAGPAIGEKGSPQCYSGGSTANYDRRVLYVAIVNCTQLGISGNSTDIGVPFAYGKFFLIFYE